MEAVLLVDVHARLPVAQRKDRPGMQPALRVSRHHGVHTVGRASGILVVADIAHKIHAEIVEPQISDRDARLQVLHLDDLFLQATELLLTVGDVVGLGIENIVTARAGHIHDDHAALHPLL